MAMLMLKKQSPAKWLVSKFIKDHNHDQLQTSIWKRMNAKPRKLEEIDIDVEEVEEEDEKESCAEEEGFRVPFPFGNLDLEPYEGMQFQTEEAARTFYYTYASNAGFTVRISKCRRARDGSIISWRFVCSKEGHYVRKYGRTKRSRALTRVGCLARLFVKRLDSGIWVIASFVKEHNHPPFVDGEELGHQLVRHTNHGDGASLAASSCSLPNCMDTEMQNGENSMTWRFNMLHREGIRFAEEGAASVETFNVAMLALREATQKVNAAKNNAVMAPLTNNSTSHRLSTNQGNSTTLLSQQCSNTGNNNKALCCEGMLNHQANDSVGVPSATKLVNSQALNPQDNQERNIIVPGAVQTEQSPTENSFDENTSVSSGMQEGNKRKYRLADDEMENLITVQDYNEGNSKQDGVQTQTQGWNLIGMTQRGSNTGSGDNSTNVSLSVAQVAALQAVAEVFNVPSMGSMSSSARPVGVLPVSKELLEGWQVLGRSSRYQPWAQEAPKLSCCSGPNPLVHAAAIAAGARIAPPSVAASLIKAVQSRSAVHIRSGESSAPRVPVVRRGLPTLPGAHQDSNACYLQREESILLSPLVTGGSDQIHSTMDYNDMPLVSTGGSDQVHSPMDYNGMRSSLTSMVEQTNVSNTVI